MSEELKSAWEIALAKLESDEGMKVDKLTEKQKEAISEIRKKYQARIAEVEIGTESKIVKAVQSGDFDGIPNIKQHVISEKERLNQEMEKEISKIRNKGTS